MSTVTYTIQGAMAATYRPASTQTKVQAIVSTITFSTGDVYVLNNIKLPHRAVVTGVSVKGSVVDGTYLIRMGTVGSNGSATLFGSKTFSATAALALTAITTSVPTTISVSDDAQDRFQTFAVTVDGAATSGTASVSLQFIVQYYCP